MSATPTSRRRAAAHTSLADEAVRRRPGTVARGAAVPYGVTTAQRITKPQGSLSQVPGDARQQYLRCVPQHRARARGRRADGAQRTGVSRRVLAGSAAAFDTGGGQSKKVGLVGTSLELATHSIATPTSRRRAAAHTSLADEAVRRRPGTVARGAAVPHGVTTAQRITKPQGSLSQAFATVRFVTTMSRCTSNPGARRVPPRQEAGPALFSRDVTRSIAKRSSSRSIGLRMTGIEPRPARWSGGAAVTAMTGIEASVGSLCWRR